jgi:hypothetical protein
MCATKLATKSSWCVRDDTGVQYFWGAETPVSREEYLAHSGKEDCV